MYLYGCSDDMSSSIIGVALVPLLTTRPALKRDHMVQM